MRHPKTTDHTHLFPFFFLGIFITQFILWRTVIFADYNYWISKIEIFGNELSSFNLVYNPIVDAPHPGTFFLIFTQIFRTVGFSPAYSLVVTEVLINTLLISIICLLAYYLFPKKLWWLCISFFFIFNNFAFYSNPVDIIVSEFVVVAFLCTLWHFQKPKNTPLSITVTLGASLGLGLASRVHITTAITLILLVCLLFIIHWRRVLLIASTTTLTAWLFIPYLWKNPLSFFSFFSYTNSLYDASSISLRHGYHLSILDLIIKAPMASISFVLLVIFIIFPEKITILELPRKFLLTLLVVLTVTSGIILQSNMVDIRFLYPMFFLSQVFLPLYLLELLNMSLKNRVLFDIFQKKKILAALVIIVNCAAFLFLATYLLLFGFMYERILLLTIQIQLLLIVFIISASKLDLPTGFQKTTESPQSF